MKRHTYVEIAVCELLELGEGACGVNEPALVGRVDGCAPDVNADPLALRNRLGRLHRVPCRPEGRGKARRTSSS
jgi:hypothetical protein